MKRTVNVLSALLICFACTSCDEDLLDVDFDTTVKSTIVAHVDQGQETIDQSVDLSMDNNDTHDYLDKIKDVKIKKFTYKIISFSGNTEAYVDVDLYANTIILKTEGFNVKSAYDAATVFEITDVNKLNSMADLLKNNKSITVGISGQTTSNESEVNFNIEVTAELEVTANPL
ncbi:hypothetical protein HPE56_09630 [Maribacter sp. ANRC-HE7]|uniref:Uncharacterized protein n=1 Tax=Maribacter aquimaris TaxID=2737171 RepID=A0ABR7V4H8_9FLAO|nr:hypothetical protein [Maribacter aquimaris]MBD0778053.1 hypothetical protein [Maribacter aquimaris]